MKKAKIDKIEKGTHRGLFDWILETEGRACHSNENSAMIRVLVQKFNEVIDVISDVQKEIPPFSGKYLITTDYFFFGPDGKRYRAAWGNVQVLEDTFLGVKTNRNATNWYLKVGSEEKHVIVAGCQMHFAIRCEEKPSCNLLEEWMEGGSNNLKSQTEIYIGH